MELGPVDLEEDEPDRATEDLRFRPRNSAAAEVSAGSEHRGAQERGTGNPKEGFSTNVFQSPTLFQSFGRQVCSSVLTV